MPMYGLKSPDAYPVAFHSLLEKGFVECWSSPDGVARARWPSIPFPGGAVEARREQRRFDAFKVNLRKHPLHRLHGIVNACKVRCEIVDGAEGFWLNFKFAKPGASLDAVAKAIGFLI